MTNSDSTFLITIGIITGILILFMVVAAFLLLRSESTQERPTPPTDEPQLIPPVEMTVTPPPKERPEDSLPSIPPVEDVVASPPQEIPKQDLPAIPSIEIVAAPPPKEQESNSNYRVPHACETCVSKLEIKYSAYQRSSPVDNFLRKVKQIMRQAVIPIVVGLLWAIGLVAALIVPLPIFLYIPVLVIVLVAAFRRAGPINFLHIAMGFLSWLVFNTLLWIRLLGPDWQGDPFGLVRGFILLYITIPALLVLSLGGRWISMGVFLWILVNAMGTLLFIALGLIEYEGFFSALLGPFFLHVFYPSP